jgi:hypothetical protein
MIGGPEKPEIDEQVVPSTKTVLYRSNLPTSGGTIRASAVVWSPVLKPLKSQLCYDQSVKSASCNAASQPAPAYPYQRAQLNRALKDGLLDDCLADAIIYQGKSRDAISEQMQSALLTAIGAAKARSTKAEAAAAASTEQTPLVVITESLGSKVAFDALYKLLTSNDSTERAAGVRTLERTTQIFMGANQMPLLALADQSIDGQQSLRVDDKSYPPDPLGAVLQLRMSQTTGPVGPTPRVIAFTDPNDLLSYILVPSRATVSYEVVDVAVSNDDTYFGFLERPDSAHLGYRSNPAVVKLIACGSAGCAK